MQVSEQDLTANLLAIRTTVDNMLRLIHGVEELRASKDPAQCEHPNVRKALGGYRFCPDCNSEWREELADE